MFSRLSEVPKDSSIVIARTKDFALGITSRAAYKKNRAFIGQYPRLCYFDLFKPSVFSFNSKRLWVRAFCKIDQELETL